MVFNTAPVDGSEVVIERVTSLDRSINYQTYNNSFRPETLNYDLDRIWHVLQEDKITDAEILARIKDEIEWRRTHNTEWDLLAQAREQGLFNALKSYMDTIGAMSVPNLFDGITDNVVITEEGVSQRVTNRDLKQGLLDSETALTNLKNTVSEFSLNAQAYTDAEKNRATSEEQRIETALIAETARAVTVEQTLRSYTESIASGFLTATETLAELQATAGTKGKTAKVMNDGANSGDYYHNGTSWIKGYSAEDAVKTWANTNALFAPKTIAAGVNLNTLTTVGIYNQNASANATLELNYPVTWSGVLNVYVPYATTVIQEYVSLVTVKTYKRYLQGGNWSAWKETETVDGSQAKVDAGIKANVKHIEWFMTANNYQPTYDVVNKVLNIPYALVAPCNLFTAHRIFLPACSISIDLQAVPNGVLYLDLTKVPTSGTLTVEDVSNVITFASYPTFRGEAHLVPLVKQDRTRNAGAALVACKGFPTVKNSFEIEEVKTSPVLEWQKVDVNSSVVFDQNTKQLRLNGYLLAPYSGVTSKRIRIYNVTVNFDTNFQVLYIDTAELGTGDIVQADVGTKLKIGTYSSASGFTSKPTQIALAKYNSGENKVYPASGFLAITTLGANTGEATGDVNSSDYIEFDKTAELLNTYLPTTSGKKIKIGLYHLNVPFDGTSPDSQSDLWRLYKAVQCDGETLTPELELVNAGEWECAITHANATHVESSAKDHVGGYHGDELQISSKFFVDGIEKDQNFISNLNKAKAIGFTQHSKIYFQDTQTELAEHFKFIEISKDGVYLKQKLIFLTNVDLSTAWVTMLPILRTSGAVQITDRSARSNDYYTQVDDNTVENFTRRYTPVNDGTKIKLWSNDNKYSAEVELIKTAKFSNQENVFITNGGGYNKVYVSATNGVNSNPMTVPKDTVWEIETKYRFNIAA